MLTIASKTTTLITRVLAVVATALLFAPTTARAQTEEVVYYHTDAIGSVRAITDETGAVIERYDFLPFGEALPSTVPETRQFAGKERDAETGLDYFGARYHMSATGRFTTVDPVMNVEAALTDPQRWNRYSYATNRPLLMIDPDGRDPRLVGGLIGAAVYAGWNAYMNAQQGRAWYEGAGVEAGKGFVVGFTLGLAAPAMAGATARIATATSVPAASSAYDNAAAGGKHSGFLLGYAQKSTRELSKAVSSFEKEIETHLDKIRNPVKHIQEFNTFDPRHQKDLLQNKWPSDIIRLREQRDIVKRLLEERF